MENQITTHRRLPWLVFFALFAIFAVAQPLSWDFSVGFAHDPVGNLDDNLRVVSEGSFYRRVALISFAIVGLWALFRKSPNQLQLQGLLGLAILMFLGWLFATYTWSTDRPLTVRKLIALALLCIGTIGTAKWFSRRELVWFVFFSTFTVLVSGLAAELTLGTFEPWSSGYRFSGVTWHSFSAWNFSLLALAGFALFSQIERRKSVLVAVVATALLLIVLTKTRAAAASFVAGTFFFVALTWTRQRIALVACLAAFVAASAVLTAELAGADLYGDVIAAINLGRGTESVSDLTGRTEVWNQLVPYIEARPLIGYGYDSFWTPDRLIEFYRTSWAVTDSHNALIELVLGTGFIGLGLLLLVFVLGVWRAVVCYKATGDTCFAFMGSALIVAFVNALAIGVIVAPYLNCFVAMLVLAQLGFVNEARQARAVNVHATRHVKRLEALETSGSLNLPSLECQR